MDENPNGYLEDWRFHQATGMVAVQYGTCDMAEAVRQLVALAARRHESPQETAWHVVARQVRLERSTGDVAPNPS